MATRAPPCLGQGASSPSVDPLRRFRFPFRPVVLRIELLDHLRRARCRRLDSRPTRMPTCHGLPDRLATVTGAVVHTAAVAAAEATDQCRPHRACMVTFRRCKATSSSPTSTARDTLCRTATSLCLRNTSSRAHLIRPRQTMLVCLHLSPVRPRLRRLLPRCPVLTP